MRLLHKHLLLQLQWKMTVYYLQYIPSKMIKSPLRGAKCFLQWMSCLKNLTWNSMWPPPHNPLLYKLHCLCPFHDLPGRASPVVTALDGSQGKPYMLHKNANTPDVRCMLNNYCKRTLSIHNRLHEVSTWVLILGCPEFIIAGGSVLSTSSSIFSHSFSTSNLERRCKIYT